MKAKETASLRFKKFVYYLDEAFVFLVAVAAVICSSAVQSSIASGTIENAPTITLSWTKILIASIITILIYGTMNDSYKFDENKPKPPLIKRLYNAVIQGIGWTSLLGMSGV